MKTRAGVTLIEVLVAIFIMAIGLLAILTLFPLGALSMAEAIKNQRISEAAEQANAIANAQNIRMDPTVVTAFTTADRGKFPANWTGASNPVFVDPWGLQINPAGTTLGPVQRTGLSFITSRSLTMRWCGLQDELTFLINGTPDTTSGLQRDPRTTWAYWLRRPNNANRNEVELSIVVYHNRNLQLGSAETLVTNPVYAAATPTSVAVPVGTDIRTGQWLVDVTANGGPIQGTWYRVVGANDSPIGTQLDLEPTPVVAIQQLIIMEDVSEVFYKGTGWK